MHLGGWVSLSLQKSWCAGQGVARFGVNLDLLAGRDVFLAAGDQSFASRDAGGDDCLLAKSVAGGHGPPFDSERPRTSIWLCGSFMLHLVSYGRNGCPIARTHPCKPAPRREVFEWYS